MKKNIFFLFILLLSISCSSGKKIEVQVANPVNLDRNNEIIEINKDSIVNRLALKDGEKFVILDGKNQVTYQIVNDLETNDSLLIFPVTVASNGNATYIIQKGKPAAFEPKVFGRFVPERKDDFAWENDKVAFRIYGPALQATGEISNGMDFWAKRTDKLIINKWYADDLAGKQSYHKDNGEGLDFYKVGPTLGMGATAPYLNDSLWYDKNFVNYQVLENGPLRMTVKLEYAPFNVDKNSVTETRIISLDVGNQLNKITLIYKTPVPLTLASGIVTRNSDKEEVYTSPANDFIAHAEPNDSVNGTIYGAVVAPVTFNTTEVIKNHVIAINPYLNGTNYVYYAGGGWSKSGFAKFEDWKNYIRDFSEKLKTPLTVTLK